MPKTERLQDAGAARTMGHMFQLHERLAADTAEVTELSLCRVLLMRDARFPWLILVPERADITEIHQLKSADRLNLMAEIVEASEVVERLFQPDKINVGALGNLVPQLHVHVIGRRRDDPAWPGPVWGHGAAEPYAQDVLQDILSRLQAAFSAG